MKLLFTVIQTDTVKHYDREEYIAVSLYSLAMKENDQGRASEPIIMVPKTPRNEKAYAPWASVGQISNPVAKASKVETGMAEGIKPLVRRNNRQTGLRVGGMARSMQGERHLLSGVTGRRDAHLSLPGEAA